MIFTIGKGGYFFEQVFIVSVSMKRTFRLNDVSPLQGGASEVITQHVFMDSGQPESKYSQQ